MNTDFSNMSLESRRFSLVGEAHGCDGSYASYGHMEYCFFVTGIVVKCTLGAGEAA